MDSISREPTADAADAAGVGKRARKRDSLFLMGRLSIGSDGAANDVRVRNLSEGGLMADVDTPVAPGTSVTLELRGIGEVGGTVAWYAAGRIGIALDTPIDPQRARKPVGHGAKTPFYAKSVKA